MERKIEEQKLMLKHLHTRVSDHVKEKNSLMDTNDELVEQNKRLKERCEQLCRKNEMNFKEIGEFCWELEEIKKVVLEKSEEIEVLEKRKLSLTRL